MKILFPLVAAAALALLAGGIAAAGESPTGAPHIEIGKVRLFRAENRVEVEGLVAVQRNLIELFACAEGGKAHESVLVLDARPSNLNLALKLLGLNDGGQVKVKRTVRVRRNGEIVDEEQEVLEENGPNWLGDPRRPMGDRVIVTVRWKDKDDKEVEVRAEDLIFEPARNRSMPRAGWIYAGSRFAQNPLSKRDEIVADHSKTVMTTWHDPDAILDNPLPDGGDDEIYYANPDVVPPRGTRVTLVIRKPSEAEEKEAEGIENAERKAADERRPPGEKDGETPGEEKE